MNRFLVGFGLGFAIGILGGAEVATAHADTGSYLASAHDDPELASASDFWLMAAGAKACAGGYIPPTPAGQALTRIAHRELCP